MMKDRYKYEIEPRMLSREEACAYVGLGRTRGVEFLKAIGYEAKVGGKFLYDRKIIDTYFDSVL